jgi:toxin secretion/phage lysis holin
MSVKDYLLHVGAAGIGALVSFFTGLPPILLVLLAVMTLDYITGIMTGLAGVSSKSETGGLSSSTAMVGILKKILIVGVVSLAYLLDYAVTLGAGVEFAAVSSATCFWFIASEGISVIENAAQIGVPIPGVLRSALDIMRKKGDTPPANTEKNAEKTE